ncbi:unnamed protein product [Protopolystoma xenopodis]|uniref:Ubiquitin carboxyl-terminal hydrolase 7 ICP0-binding domain-containing protein n=1 Tax=Protopolystoma xenopodis TaxID=117903 RepID=A0A3S5FCY3_9PLAT|nr:unnamed protein product [Protopolystoma xenopodis]
MFPSWQIRPELSKPVQAFTQPSSESEWLKCMDDSSAVSLPNTASGPTPIPIASSSGPPSTLTPMNFLSSPIMPVFASAGCLIGQTGNLLAVWVQTLSVEAPLQASLPEFDADHDLLIFVKFYQPPSFLQNRSFAELEVDDEHSELIGSHSLCSSSSPPPPGILMTTASIGSLSYLGWFTIRLHTPLAAIIPDLRRRAQLPETAQLRLFEEVRPGDVRLIPEPRLPVEKCVSYLSDGNILVYEVVPIIRFEASPFSSLITNVANGSGDDSGRSVMTSPDEPEEIDSRETSREDSSHIFPVGKTVDKPGALLHSCFRASTCLLAGKHINSSGSSTSSSGGSSSCSNSRHITKSDSTSTNSEGSSSTPSRRERSIGSVGVAGNDGLIAGRVITHLENNKNSSVKSDQPVENISRAELIPDSLEGRISLLVAGGGIEGRKLTENGTLIGCVKACPHSVVSDASVDGEDADEDDDHNICEKSVLPVDEDEEDEDNATNADAGDELGSNCGGVAGPGSQHLSSPDTSASSEEDLTVSSQARLLVEDPLASQPGSPIIRSTAAITINRNPSNRHYQQQQPILLASNRLRIFKRRLDSFRRLRPRLRRQPMRRKDEICLAVVSEGAGRLAQILSLHPHRNCGKNTLGSAGFKHKWARGRWPLARRLIALSRHRTRLRPVRCISKQPKIKQSRQQQYALRARLRSFPSFGLFWRRRLQEAKRIANKSRLSAHYRRPSTIPGHPHHLDNQQNQRLCCRRYPSITSPQLQHRMSRRRQASWPVCRLANPVIEATSLLSDQAQIVAPQQQSLMLTLPISLPTSSPHRPSSASPSFRAPSLSSPTLSAPLSSFLTFGQLRPNASPDRVQICVSHQGNDFLTRIIWSI